MRAVNAEGRLVHVLLFVASDLDWILAAPNVCECDSTILKSSKEVQSKGVWNVYVR